MQMHLEKAHQLVAEDLHFFAAEQKSSGRGRYWNAEIEGTRRAVLFEIEARELLPKRHEPEPSAAERHASHWDPAAMREVYRSRQGASQMF